MATDLTSRLKKQAHELGFNLVGVVEARPGVYLAAYKRWLTNAYHGQMGYMARPDRVVRRENLEVILPSVKSIVCVGLGYYSGQPPPDILNDPSRGRISNYAWGLDYHDLMEPRLKQLGGWLREQAGAEVESKAYVDTGAILERDHGQSAGLGFTGKNTMLIHPRSGSYFFLGELLTTAELRPDEIDGRLPGCGSCQACLVACPTDAFPEPYVLDARRCISYLTIELKGWIPRELRPLMGNWVYGCDICQQACPFNRFAQQSSEKAFQPQRWETIAPSLIELLSLDEPAFSRRFEGSPIKRIKRRGLVRNACVAAGNWGSQKAVPALVRLLAGEEPLIRGHAAWALGRIDGEGIPRLLVAAQENEVDEGVKDEIRLALE
jgi:epoxyqueuosine reductase